MEGRGVLLYAVCGGRTSENSILVTPQTTSCLRGPSTQPRVCTQMC